MKNKNENTKLSKMKVNIFKESLKTSNYRKYVGKSHSKFEQKLLDRPYGRQIFNFHKNRKPENNLAQNSLYNGQNPTLMHIICVICDNI